EFAQVLRAMEEIGEFQMVTLHQLMRLGLDQRGTEAEQNGSHATQELPIDHGRLREVRNFGGAANVRQRRQKKILHHGTKEHVCAELVWRIGDLRQERVTSDLRTFDSKFPVVGIGAMNRQALSIADNEQKGGGLRHLDLLVIARMLQFLSALQ